MAQHLHILLESCRTCLDKSQILKASEEIDGLQFVSDGFEPSPRFCLYNVMSKTVVFHIKLSNIAYVWPFMKLVHGRCFAGFVSTRGQHCLGLFDGLGISKLIFVEHCSHIGNNTNLLYTSNVHGELVSLDINLSEIKRNLALHVKQLHSFANRTILNTTKCGTFKIIDENLVQLPELGDFLDITAQAILFGSEGKYVWRQIDDTLQEIKEVDGYQTTTHVGKTIYLSIFSRDEHQQLLKLSSQKYQ